MYYYGARYYDPRISIFVSVDPLAEEFEGWTPYHYVHNNPINLIDPTGMSADGWYENNQGEIKYDKRINNQSDLKKYNLDGEFIGNSFVGKDEYNNRYDFKQNGKVSLLNKDEKGENENIYRDIQKIVTVLSSKSIKSVPTQELASAFAISQSDSPAPGPADVFATLVVLQAAVSYFTKEEEEQTIRVDYFAKSKKGKLSQRQEEVQHRQTGNGKLTGAKKTKHQKRRPGDMGDKKR